MSDFVSAQRIKSLKTGIESKTGETYSDLTGAVQALADGYNDASALDEQLAGMIGLLDGVVTGGGGYKTASGTIVLDADAPYIKVTGLEFTPIVFVVVPTTIIATSTVGAVFVRGAGGLWRTGTGNMNPGVMSHKLELDGYTVYPDDSEFGTVAGSNYYAAVRVFDSGFGFYQYNSSFPIRAGTVLEWWAIGE